MKKLFVIIIGLCIVSLHLDAATRSSRSKNRRILTVKYPTPNEIQCRENIDYCFNYYCFDKKTLTNGVYSKCGAESASIVQLNVEDCLDTRSIVKTLDLKEGCRGYTYNYIVALLGNKDIVESSKKKNTKECHEATISLNAAKACWAKMISHDGSIDPALRTQLVALCGYAISKDPEMVDRFYNAGNYGDSNIAAQMDLQLTGQLTQKRENWRQIVDAVLAGYMEMSELICGEEDYDITKVNDYLPDSRTNLAMIKQQAQAEEIGRQTANRVVNSWFRRTDCVNSALPKGGLKWEYIEDGDPDCRIICMDGYEPGENSSECIEIKSTAIAFNGFVDSDRAYVGEPQILQPQNNNNNNNNATPEPSNYVNPFTETNNNDGYKSSTICSKNLHPRTLSDFAGSSKKEQICHVFFPDCKYGYLGRRRWYQRYTSNASEFFCIGDNFKDKGEYDFWVNFTLSEVNKAFGINKPIFGSKYKEQAAKYLVDTCPSICGAQSTNICGLVPEISYNYINQWKNFVTTYATENMQCCSKFTAVVNAINETEWNDKEHGNGYFITNLTNEMQNLRNCLCNGTGTDKNAQQKYCTNEVMKNKLNQNYVSPQSNAPSAQSNAPSVSKQVTRIPACNTFPNTIEKNSDWRKERSDVVNLGNKILNTKDWVLPSLKKCNNQLNDLNNFINILRDTNTASNWKTTYYETVNNKLIAFRDCACPNGYNISKTENTTSLSKESIIQQCKINLSQNWDIVSTQNLWNTFTNDYSPQGVCYAEAKNLNKELNSDNDFLSTEKIRKNLKSKLDNFINCFCTKSAPYGKEVPTQDKLFKLNK